MPHPETGVWGHAELDRPIEPGEKVHLGGGKYVSYVTNGPFEYGRYRYFRGPYFVTASDGGVVGLNRFDIEHLAELVGYHVFKDDTYEELADRLKGVGELFE